MTQVIKTISEADKFSDPIAPSVFIPAGYAKDFSYGHLNLSISGTWEGTVSVQRSFDQGGNLAHY